MFLDTDDSMTITSTHINDKTAMKVQTLVHVCQQLAAAQPLIAACKVATYSDPA